MPGGLAPAGFHPPQLNVYRRSPMMGDYFTDAALLAPVPVVGTIGAGIFSAAGLLTSFTGGSVVDQQRQARVNYFLQQALQGNVAAAQLILGGPSNVSGNETTMWTQAATSLGGTAVGRQTLDEARQLGPMWLVGSGDTATNYPAMKAFTQQWALTNQPVGAAVNAIFGTTGGPVIRAAAGAVPSWVYLAAGAGVLYFMFGSRRRG